MDAETIKAFCAGIVSLEDDRKSINDQIRDEIESFSNSHNMTKRSVKEAVKVYKAQQKDAAETELVERERDLLVEAMMGAENEPSIQ